MPILSVCEKQHNAGNTPKKVSQTQTLSLKVGSFIQNESVLWEFRHIVLSSVISGIISYVLPIILSLASAADVSVRYGNTTRAPRFANSLAVSNPMLL